MPSFGFTLMGELFPPEELVRNAELAEQAGFDFAAFSDHFHPWLDAQGQSPFTWSVLGAVAERTERIRLITMVTCPTLRYHPAIIAQAAATVARLSGDRFTLGLGAGENLNEHVVGHGWPAADLRQEMLEEAVEIIRLLWSGGFQTFRGQHLELEDARLYTLPDEPVPIALAAGGPEAATLAGRVADALIATEPEQSYVEAFRNAGGDGPAYGQVALSWHEDEAEARRLARERWRFALPGWKVMAELPNPVNFDAATQGASEDQIAELVPCGPDPEVQLQGIRKFLDAGSTASPSSRRDRTRPASCASGSASSRRACRQPRSASSG
jgi:G6PDH family F420-dependent oxidoreductase